MSSTASSLPAPLYYHLRTRTWMIFAALAAVLCIACRDSLAAMVKVWIEQPEYSHGFLIPVLSAFLVWQRKAELAQLDFRGHWSGVALVGAACLLYLIGQLATLLVIQQHALIFMLAGIVLSLGGWPLLRLLAVPLGLLFFMVPLPIFLLNNFSAQLQLLSSQIGVAVIRMFGISVALEGNVIDLGTYKLEVAEACSGLRYLFPLMTLGFVMAYFFKRALWKRALLFLSTIPITVLMNSIRIGLIGVTVEHWGAGMADGFLHDFEGWIVFMASAGLLIVEMILLARLGRDTRPWREVFGVEFPEPLPSNAGAHVVTLPRTFFVAGVLLFVLAGMVELAPARAETPPRRTTFASFANDVGPWRGTRDVLLPVYLNALKLSDYLMSDYRAPGKMPVNFYIAWYDAQRSGESAHSPRSCLPGGGWRIENLRQVAVPGVNVGGVALRVNRAQIAYADQKQLVYYWFQQRGRVITNEYAVKWYLLWDSLIRHRSDGAMIRLIAPLAPGQSVEQADVELAGFLATVAPQLPQYIPD